jgi:predicted TPR repeat methyltransferase
MTDAPLALSQPSGDPTADRRLAFARDLAASGRPAEAADLAGQALELVPGWAVGWFVLAGFHETAGAVPEAIAAYETALRLDPADRCGAALRLARLGARALPTDTTAHVRALFDDYAPRFEASLVGALDYRAPALLAAAIERAAPGRRFAHALDLGCGTGLMGRAIRARVDRLDGVDLAAEMVARARAGGGYDRLTVGDLASDLAERPAASHDLVTAADVFCYLGDLTRTFVGVGRVMTGDGLFAFSVERGEATETDAAVVIGEGLRFAHRESHLTAAAATAGLVPLGFETVTLRRDRGRPVIGTLALFTKS